MALSELQLVPNPTGLPEGEEFVWLRCVEGDQLYLVKIPRGDVEGLAAQGLSRSEQDAMIANDRDKLLPIIEARRAHGQVNFEAMLPLGAQRSVIPLTRPDLEEAGIRLNPVSSTASTATEWTPEQGGYMPVRRPRHPSLDPVGQPSIPLPLQATPQQPPEPQQPIVSPGIIGDQPSPGAGATGTSLPVQSYLITTPLVYPTPPNYAGAPSLVSLTLRFGDGLHNLLPGHMAAAVQEDLAGWVRIATTSREQVLNLLARVGTQPDGALREAIVEALDQRAGALQFSDPRSFRVADLMRLATAVAAFSALGSEALAVVALAGSCFILLQVFWGLGTVANYAITQIGTALVDKVAEKVRAGGTPPR